MSILDFSYKSINIQGDYSFNKTSLLKYPYLYTISGNSVYKLNVITGISEVYANIDYSKLAKPYSSSLSDYLPQLFGSLKNINTDKFYFIIRVRDEQYDYSYYLCSFDLNTFQVNNHQKLSSLDVLYTNSTVYGMSSTIKQIDNDNLRIYHYWAYLDAGTASTGNRYSYYEVFNYNINTKTLEKIMSTYEHSRQSTALSYQVNTMNPQIFNDSNEQFFYGQKYQNGSTNSSIGFSKVKPPTNGTTLNNSAYYYTGMFEYGDYYYIIGGSKGDSANTDLIKVNKNSMVSEKIGDISITSTPPSVSQYENIVVFINDSSRYLLIEFPLEDNKKLTLEELLSHTANAIRSKKGTTEPINAQDFPKEIENLQTGGVDEDTLYTELLNGAYGSDSLALISFTISGTSYQAEDGMTWEEWSNSDYNINKKYGFNGPMIMHLMDSSNMNYYVCDTAQNCVTQQDVIEANGVYNTKYVNPVGGEID